MATRSRGRYHGAADLTLRIHGVTLDLHASIISWHLEGLRNPWARMALGFAGFGRSSENDHNAAGHWRPVLSITSSFGGATEDNVCSEIVRRSEQSMRNDECNLGEPGPDSFVEHDGEKSAEKNRSSATMPEEGIDSTSTTGTGM